MTADREKPAGMLIGVLVMHIRGVIEALDDTEREDELTPAERHLRDSLVNALAEWENEYDDA